MDFSLFTRAALVCALLAAGPASAELMLHPTRLVFEKNQRAAQVELINNGSERTTYRISLVNRRMTESGEFVAADTAAAGELFAAPMLNYAPRQITLEPGGAQTVRVMLRKPADLAEGEYRSHLQFDMVPEAAGGASIEQQQPGAPGSIGINLKALVGAAMPVIVRHGEGGASVVLSALALAADGAPLLSLCFERSGAHSVYGDISVGFSARGGSEIALAKVGGVAVYSPNRSRSAKVPLQLPPGVTLAHGVLKVSYRERPDAGGRELAHAELVLP
ncbi:MAG: fimbria/pilus periplasmic chaperone [Massilia sp.]